MSGDAPARRGAREMSGSAERMRAWRGPAILSFGFRPFFLGAGAFAAIAMVLWIGMLSGRVAVPTAFDPVSWHAHELLWGYFSAVAAGFLLTAVPNWTGRLPLVGWPLAVLAGLWLAGRLAVAFSAHLPALAAAAVDLSFLAALTLAIGREIVTGRNWRNLKVLALLTVLTGANAAFHAEALAGDYAAGGYGFRIGLGVAVMLISVIGGRVVPSFTRNWLARRAPGRLPAPFGRVDQAALALTLIALAAWVVAPGAAAAGGLCLAAGAANLLRLARWAGWRTGAEPLVWVLHAGFFFVALGFAALRPDLLTMATAQHVWTAGAIGVMSLAMMTRASLGHSGRALTASHAVTAVYLAVIGAVAARLAYGVAPGQGWLLHLSALAWIAAFAGFTLTFLPLLALPRRDRIDLI
jgi:uncharacterized protein involved in response to NO